MASISIRSGFSSRVRPYLKERHGRVRIVPADPQGSALYNWVKTGELEGGSGAHGGSPYSLTAANCIRNGCLALIGYARRACRCPKRKIRARNERERTSVAGHAYARTADDQLYGFAVFQTPLTPSPVLSPGFESFTHKYSGWPLYAHCFDPSSRVMIV